MSLTDAVLSLDDALVRVHLKEHPQALHQDEAPVDVLHVLLTRKDASEITRSLCARNIVYLLRNHGLNVNHQNQEGDTPLHLALRHSAGSEITEALLQCGADIHLRNKNGTTPLSMAERQSDIPDTVRDLVFKYKPGLWRAVQDDDLTSVRKLINLWSRVDIQKNGRSLKELALSKGTEHIIRLILDINPSMRLAHAAMAGDLISAQTVCNDHKQINVNFKNMGDMGATPLFYAIMNNDLDLVKLLRKHRAKIDCTITFEDNDIPLYFTALNRDIDPEIIKCLTPQPSEMPHFTTLHYKGRSVLQYCIENDVSPGVVRHILRLGYPQMVVARDTNSLCAREIAQQLGKHEYVQIIDEVVHDWYLDNTSSYRQHLALHGYPYLKHAQKDGVQAHEVIVTMETSSDQAGFHSALDAYQDHIQHLHAAVEACDLGRVEKLLVYSGPCSQHFQTCLANSKVKSDGQPLLHKAVLRRHVGITELLASALVNSLGVKVDSVVDPWLRTALHYAYAIPSVREVVYTLQDHGCSDFTLDKDMRSPLVFRDHRQNLEMHNLIQHHLKRVYISEEPYPWKQLKIPLMYAPSHRHRNLQHLVSGRRGVAEGGGMDHSVQCALPPAIQPHPRGQGSRRGSEGDEENGEYYGDDLDVSDEGQGHDAEDNDVADDDYAGVDDGDDDSYQGDSDMEDLVGDHEQNGKTCTLL